MHPKKSDGTSSDFTLLIKGGFPGSPDCIGWAVIYAPVICMMFFHAEVVMNEQLRVLCALVFFFPVYFYLSHCISLSAVRGVFLALVIRRKGPFFDWFRGLV